MYDDKEGILAHEGPNPRVFMDIAIGGEPAGRIVMELYADTVPKTAEVRCCMVCCRYVFRGKGEKEPVFRVCLRACKAGLSCTSRGHTRATHHLTVTNPNVTLKEKKCQTKPRLDTNRQRTNLNPELPRAVHGGEGPVPKLGRAALLQGLHLPPLHQGKHVDGICGRCLLCAGMREGWTAAGFGSMRMDGSVRTVCALLLS